MKIYLLFVSLQMVLANVCSPTLKLIAVGDSITQGDEDDPYSESYPTHLKKMFSDPSQIEIINFGMGGKTMRKNGDGPYWNIPMYQEAMASNPDIVVLMLGTNDAKPYNWNQEEFV